MKVICPRCGYSWSPRKNRRTSRYTCPNCSYSFRLVAATTTTTTSTTTTATTTTTTSTKRFREEEIAVWIADVPRECYRDLRELAEEVSSPDSSGVEVLVLDSSVAEEVLRHYGVELDAR